MGKFFTKLIFLWLLGTAVYAQTGFIGARLEQKEDRIVFKEIIEGLPAAKAGLQAGDVLPRTVKGKDVNTVDQFIDVISSMSPGSSFFLPVRRDGKLVSIYLTVGEKEFPKPDYSLKEGIQTGDDAQILTKKSHNKVVNELNVKAILDEDRFAEIKTGTPIDKIIDKNGVDFIPKWRWEMKGNRSHIYIEDDFKKAYLSVNGKMLGFFSPNSKRQIKDFSRQPGNGKHVIAAALEKSDGSVGVVFTEIEIIEGNVSIDNSLLASSDEIKRLRENAYAGVSNNNPNLSYPLMLIPKINWEMNVQSVADSFPGKTSKPITRTALGGYENYEKLLEGFPYKVQGYLFNVEFHFSNKTGKLGRVVMVYRGPSEKSEHEKNLLYHDFLNDISSALGVKNRSLDKYSNGWKNSSCTVSANLERGNLRVLIRP